MRLLFIYGSPAVGKLTVANEIAQQTNFKVFHNHLSIDCIQPIFDFGTKSFGKLIDLIRVETVAEAALVGQNLIYTFCYAKDSDEPHISRIIQVVEENGGEVHLVLLTAEKDELRKRIVEESRQKYGKAKTIELLDYLFDNYELFSPVPERQNLIIDNTNLPAEETALQIINFYKLVEE